MKELTILCTRPTIAGELLRHGLQADLIPHPWKQNLTAWLFTITDEDRLLVAKVYGSYGLQAPKVLVKGEAEQ